MGFRCLVLLAVAVLAAACQQPGTGAGGADAPTPAAEGDLPGCGKPPSPAPEPPPAGALLPPETVVTAVRDAPPVVQLNAYVELDPAGIREWVESQPELDVVAAADLDLETQMLVTDGTWRTFVKARAVCADGSLLAEVIAAEESDAVLPTPSAP